MDTSALPAWLDRREYPFQPRHFQPEGKGSRIHYIDEGPRDAAETFLFVHGTPSWSFDWRHAIRGLSPRHRCVAADHLGFGLSDKPATADYSLAAHTARLTRLVEHLDLRGITLVVHDFGGPIALAMALAQPDRIRRVVVMNSWLWSMEREPEFIKLARILRSPLLPFLYLRLNFSARFLLPGAFGQKKLPKALRRQYTKPLGSAAERQGTLAFARSLLNDQGYFQSLWEKRAALGGKPMLLLWGMADKFVGPKVLEGWKAAFPDAQVLALAGCGHFPQEEEPEAVLAALGAFVQRPS